MKPVITLQQSDERRKEIYSFISMGAAVQSTCGADSKGMFEVTGEEFTIASSDTSTKTHKTHNFEQKLKNFEKIIHFRSIHP